MDAPRLILASRSPQRRAILQQIGVPFTVRVSDAPELMEGPPEEVVLENAFRKAQAALEAEHAAAAGGADDGAPGGEDIAVLGVDTIVALGPRIYGKPPDVEAARATLGELNGREHTVLSGVCVLHDGSTRTAAARTTVRFRTLSDAALEAYVATGEWRERAGGYAIQERGAVLVQRIEGDYLNVVGLPVATLLDLAPWLVDSPGWHA
jgi:septum formation protein